MFFCFGKKIYATQRYKNLLGKFFGAQEHFFSKSNRIHQPLGKAMV